MPITEAEVTELVKKNISGVRLEEWMRFTLNSKALNVVELFWLSDMPFQHCVEVSDRDSFYVTVRLPLRLPFVPNSVHNFLRHYSRCLGVTILLFANEVVALAS